MDSHKKIHHRYLCGGLSKLKASTEHIDTILVVGDCNFPCHRTVLAAMSTYFCAMFSSGMKESHEKIITLKGISPTHFEKVLEFLYTGNIELTYDSVVDLLQISSMYQIEALQLICEKFLANDICIQNCIINWKSALSYNSPLLEEKAFWFMTENFPELKKSRDFLELNKDELIRYIDADHLNVEKEEDVLEMVTTWLDYDLERGNKHVLEIFKFLRLPLMETDFVNRTCQKSLCVQSNKTCLEFIQKVVKANQNSNFLGLELNPCIFKLRNEHALVMVDGRRQEVFCFTLHSKKLYFLAKFPYFSNAKAACVHQGDIYVSGGSDEQTKMVKFVTEQNKWENCSDLIEPRYFHVMLSLGDYIYILGGYTKNSAKNPVTVERYDPATNEITTVGEIAHPAGKISAASYGDVIFMFGGSENYYDYVDNDIHSKPTVFHSFNTKTNTSCLYSNIPTITVGSQALTVDDTVYIFSPNGNILTLSEEKTPIIIHVLKSFDHRHFRVVNHHGCFFILQLAAPKFHDEILVLSWNPQTKEEYVLLWDKLPRTLLDSHWMKVAISKQHLRYECNRR
ncbi:kelch-like protein 24 [Biomphalaria pfeifferi]|uniref:Kelch-like protein 24 n=1 Tax=Biomphalaria pfeifferi TaxID=112525 RepID=A0AAD8FCL1_BIOPF|nr:kelch-like protein 24 [Biomphalaria pfeifferi]